MIIVDESEPIGEFSPPFPYRDVTVRCDTTVQEAYELLQEIGRGKFGRVYKCKDRGSGLVLAAKVVPVKRKDERQNVEREVEIMRRLHHPRIIQLFDAICDSRRWEMCLILEMVEGGELFDRVIEDEFVLTEKACSIFVRQICQGVEYIHSKNIIHLDMKPENVMCMSKSGNRIKIIDFGLARFYDPSKSLQVLFGTPEFVAPEVVNFEEISVATDMWSIGVMTYVLVSGLSPFMGDTDAHTMSNVTIANYDYEDECFDDVSDCAKHFIDNLLRKDPSDRLTASECLKHPWLQPHGDRKNLPAPDSESESELESVEDIPDLRQEEEDTSSNPATPDSMIEEPSVVPPPPPNYLLAKRGSLDISKGHLKEFVNRYSDNPYMFDSPRGIISHVANETHHRFRPMEDNSNEGPSDFPQQSSNNLAPQIRRFSKQLHEEMEILKRYSRSSSASSLRKGSWNNLPVNAN